MEAEWRVHAAAARRRQPQLTTSLHLCEQIEFPDTILKVNDATPFAVFKPFIFVFFFLLLLKSLQATKRCYSNVSVDLTRCAGEILGRRMYGSGRRNEPLLSRRNRKDKHFNAPPRSVGPSHRRCGQPQVVGVPHRWAFPTISSDVQYKPQTLPSEHPPNTSRRKRGDYGMIELQTRHLPFDPPKTATTPPPPHLLSKIQGGCMCVSE